MDIYCTRCGSAWDMDTLHDVVDERVAAGIFAPLDKPSTYVGPEYDAYAKEYAKRYDAVRDDFFTRGCLSLTGWKTDHCVPGKRGNMRSTVMSAAIDFMGDDIDGIASMMEDAEMMGMFD